MVTAAAAALAYLCGHAAWRPTLAAASLRQSLQVHDSEIPAHREGSESVPPPPELRIAAHIVTVTGTANQIRI